MILCFHELHTAISGHIGQTCGAGIMLRRGRSGTARLASLKTLHNCRVCVCDVKYDIGQRLREKRAVYGVSV